MTSGQYFGLAFFAPMMVVTFSMLGFYYYNRWKENKAKKGPMATFNKR
ncbi:hypothetical protein PQC65_gp077 [Aeromonas phage pAEv1810]|nr:hypothetical protein PQC65_gp077 [Aeromonas phage pAEv1810]UIS25015.1 hypothetical protein pAEv1810_77 [Aeromonas phage pAEv1810]WAX22301.1 hypothetical protein AVP1_0191 [Aeromonas phage AVP1]